jgi:hypothetical protein
MPSGNRPQTVAVGLCFLVALLALVAFLAVNLMGIAHLSLPSGVVVTLLGLFVMVLVFGVWLQKLTQQK